MTMYSKFQHRLRDLTTMLTLLSLVACTTLQTVPSGQNSYANAVTRGDQVRVTTRDGRVHEVKVREVSTNGFSGDDGQTVAFADITQLEKRKPATSKTVALVAAIVGLGIAAAAAGGGGGGGSGGY